MADSRNDHIAAKLNFRKTGGKLVVEAPHCPGEAGLGMTEQEFIEGLKLVVKNEEKVLREPRYFFCDDWSGGVGCLYLAGGAITLGIALLLWRRGEFLDICETCGGTVLLARLAGSPLSGHHFRTGYCFTCMKRQRIEGGCGTLRYYPKSLTELNKQHPNGVIRRGRKGRRFDWALGTVGEDEPDEIIRPRIEPASFREVVAALRGEPWCD